MNCRRAAALFALLISASVPPVATAARIGGWNPARGGHASIVNGMDFNHIRADLATLFPSSTVSATSQLTSSYLSSIDVLLLDPVFNVINVEVAPLTVDEQLALLTWVQQGGRALIIAENPSYSAASRSFVEPFGLQVGAQSLSGFWSGAIVDSTSFASITNGPYGVVNSFQGGFATWFSETSTATVLGAWSSGGAGIAAMKYGHGSVVFFADVALIANYHGANNTVLRQNTLNYLINVPEPATVSLTTTAATLLLLSRLGRVRQPLPLCR
jgi:hypothetical protein